MLVDASDVPASSILAIVGTLASAALLSFSLRLYTRGRLLRNLGTDDWLLLVAAICVVGVLVITVVLKVEKQAWSATADGDQTISLLVWSHDLSHILGIGFVKLSIALTVLRLAVQSWHRHTILGYISLTTILTVFWFGSTLLFGGPITIDWSSTDEPEAIFRLLGFINSVLDAVTLVLVALLPIPILSTLPSSLWTRLAVLAVYILSAATVAAAVIQTYLLHTIWQAETTPNPTPTLLLWSSIELTLATLAASLLPLHPLLSTLHHHLPTRRTSKHLTASSNSSPTQYPSHTYASTDTVIHRPSAPHRLSLRYHDTESNLDFDIATPHTRTRTHTLRSAPTHSRNVSDWSQFSGFTYYTTPAPSVHSASPRRSRGASINEIEARTRMLGGGRAGAENAHIGVAVTTLHDTPVRDSGAGLEMAELARLFADQGREWGVEARSGRVSVVVEGTGARGGGRRTSGHAGYGGG